MKTVSTLVLLDRDDPSASSFLDAIAQDPLLASHVDLRFASPENAHSIIDDVEIVTCGVLAPELIAKAPKLKWLAFWSAGLDGKVTPQIRDSSLLLTNASGVHGPNIAEHVLAMMLMFTRRINIHMRSQINHVWDRRMPFERPPAAELCGQTLGIVGLGRIGEALTIRSKAFGMRVIAVKRDAAARYNHNVNAAPDELYDPNRLPELLAASDHVCIALPYTPHTHHLFDERTLGYMKPSAYLYNIARGAIMDENALVAALQSGALAGAGLDVFEQEPLPADSPLWDMPNVIITPHVAGLTPYYFDRFAKLFAENLKRYLCGDSLNNLYQADRGY